MTWRWEDFATGIVKAQHQADTCEPNSATSPQAVSDPPPGSWAWVLSWSTGSGSWARGFGSRSMFMLCSLLPSILPQLRELEWYLS